MSDLTVLVLGATGGVGGAVYRALVARGARPLAGVRDPARATARLGPGTPCRVIDLDDHATLAPALGGVDALFLLTGYTAAMLKQSMAVLDAAARAGVRAVVHLGTSAAPTNAVAHWGWHRYVEAYVEKLGFAYTHLRPESFMQNMWVYGMLAGDRLTSHVGRARWGWVDCDDLADVAAEALLLPDVHGGTIIPMAGDAKTFPEVAEILSVELGRTVTVDDRPPADFWAGASTNPDAFALAYMRCVYEQFQLESTVGLPGAGVIHDGYSAILGRPAATWRDFARRNHDRLLATGRNPGGEPPAGRASP